MAGHSKFKNIQHRKGAQDRKRAKVFNKHAREITVAAKMGGIDPDMNPRLRLAIANARAANMPNERIKRAIDVADPNSGDATSYEEIRYEGYGPAGVAIIVESLTDNRNRTVSEVRTIFSKNGGNLGESGAVTFMFDRVGEIVYPVTVADEEAMFEAAAGAGADNVETNEGYHEIITQPDDFASVREALEGLYGDPERAGLIWKPNMLSEVDKDTAQKMMNLIDALEDSDDVQMVFTNMDVSDEIAEQLMEAS
jgi:YebC/PmpR family DNA-binding regulatory protein